MTSLIRSSTQAAAPAPNPMHSLMHEMHTVLKKGDLQKAIDLLNTEGAKLSSLTPEKRVMIVDFLKKGQVQELADRLMTLLKSFRKLFSEVNLEAFQPPAEKPSEESPRTQAGPSSSERTLQSSSSIAAVSSSSTAHPHARILEKVKTLGLKAGLTQKEVEGALEEIVEEDGRRTWMVKEIHDDTFEKRYSSWRESLKLLASQEEIIFFIEGEIRSEIFEKLAFRNNLRGLYRGLESLTTCTELRAFFFFLLISALKLSKPFDPKAFQKQVFEICLLHAQGDVLSQLQSNKVASEILKEFRFSKPVFSKDVQAISSRIIDRFPNAEDWIEFADQFLIAFTQKELDTPLAGLLQASKTLTASSHEAFLSNEVQKYLEASRPLRDTHYGRTYCRERAWLPKDKAAFVSLGESHGLGFKKAVLSQKKESLVEKSSSSQGDFKISQERKDQK